MKFVLLVAAKKKEGQLAGIIREYYRLKDELQGILNVKVTSAVPFTAVQEKDIIARMEAMTKMKVRLVTSIDADLKGGFTVQKEDTVWDASLRHQLDALRERFMEGSI